MAAVLKACVAVAPGRVNLIGDHTDYTGGYVLPMAIPFATEARVETSHDGTYRFCSAKFSNERVVASDTVPAKCGEWSDYAVGVWMQLRAKGVELQPFCLTLSGDVPLGAGLSSSASVEVAAAYALLRYAGRSLPEREVALLCQRAENEFVGSPCGIMDQFVVTTAKAGAALLLNTRDLQYELVPMLNGQLAQCRIVIANSMVRHAIAGGDYGLRRRELEAGQAVLLKKFSALRDLGDATLQQAIACEAEMSAESVMRCRHVVSENARVLQAKDAMLRGDAVAVGQLMTQSHASQRDDFECSVAEIDFLVETAMGLQGCYGARLTGGGFGGCTVNLVHRDDVDAFCDGLKQQFLSRFGLEAECYVCEATDGAAARQDRLQGSAAC